MDSALLVADSRGGTAAPAQSSRSVPAVWWRWMPCATAVIVGAGLLLAADTSIVDIAKYAVYAVLAVVLPGTLLFRALRRNPHSFVEDVAFGAAVGLALELGAWALFSALDLRSVIWLWPLAILAPFAAVPGLRRHWRVRQYPAAVPVSWSWVLAGVIVFFTAYLYGVFFSVNPIVPDSESARQFLDLPYQLALAGEAKHNFPPGLPQVAGEPLRYHWFSFVHLAMTSMVGHIDLPVVTMRLMVPAVCALTAVLTAVVGWRLTGRRWVGATAAILFFVIGEAAFGNDPTGWPVFPTQATFVIWPSLSMTYSWALLVALIGLTGDVLRRQSADNRVPQLGRGAFVLVALLALAASAAKASTLPVLLAALAAAGLALLVTTRRLPWAVIGMGAIVGLAQLFATGAVFAFQSYGLKIVPLANFAGLWAEPAGGRAGWKQALIVAAVVGAFGVNVQLRAAGIVPLVWRRRGRLEPLQWFLLGGAVAGPAFYMVLEGFNASWFTRAGFPFSLVLSAWGYALVFERAALSRRGKLVLGGGAAVLAVGLTAINWAYAGTAPLGRSFSRIMPALTVAVVLGGLFLLAAGAWWPASRRWPALRGRGAVALLTAVLVTGVPGLVMDVKNSWGVPGGAWTSEAMPASRAQAARWVRAHSEPGDILATNVHFLHGTNPRSFWLSGYAERSVLVEGWAFAPRMAGLPDGPFWDSGLFQANEDAFYRPTVESLRELRDRHRVRYLVAGLELPVEREALSELAALRYDNGRVAVYELVD